jgi:hypothetical protein
MKKLLKTNKAYLSASTRVPDAESARQPIEAPLLEQRQREARIRRR